MSFFARLDVHGVTEDWGIGLSLRHIEFVDYQDWRKRVYYDARSPSRGFHFTQWLLKGSA